MTKTNDMNRREFLKTMATATALAALGPAACFRPQEANKISRRPNILMIMSDEHNAGVLGSYGNRVVQTPNLDNLTQSGVVFDNCYCNSPLCVPSRLSFISGKYASRVGAWSNSCRLPSADYPSLPRTLNAAGYESFLCGKMHFDPTRRYGFEEIGTAFTNQTHKTGRGKRRAPDDLIPKAGISARLMNAGVGEESIVLSHDRDTTAGTVEFLKKRKADDKPFFLIAGYLAPHFPLIVPEKYWQFYKGKVPMPQIPENHLESQPRNYKHLRVAFYVDEVPGKIVRKARELYYGLTHWLDNEIGKILKVLAQSQVEDNTIVIYTSDHGENIGEHGLWWKNCMYEQSSRLPLILSWPARWKGGQRRAQVCSLVDLNRTIAEIAGAKTAGDYNGDSMVQWLDNPQTYWKDFAVSEYYAHFVASGFAMIRTDRYKYVYHTPADEKHPAERELYDLKADPGEFDNLAALPEQKERVHALHVDLVKELGEDPDKTEQRCRADYARGYSRADVKKK